MFAGFTDTVRNRIDSTLMSQKGNKSTQLFQMTDTALNQYAFTRLGREEKSSLRFTNAFNTIVYQTNCFIRGTKRSCNNNSNEYKAGNVPSVSAKISHTKI